MNSKLKLIGLISVILAITPSFLVADDSTQLFATVRDSVAIITAGQSSGSGFVVQIDGKKYLITNEHVIRGGQPFSATLLTGKKLSFASLDVAEDCDLVRLELSDTNITALVMSPIMHNINEPIAVFGNSDGGGVATSISGKIIGIGPLFIEVDAPFVHGNSGSPIVDDKGAVVAVATYAFKDSDPSDWVKQGTRYTEVRRFGLKMNNAQWKRIDAVKYFARADALSDIETFCEDLYKLRNTGEFVNQESGLIDYRYSKEKKRYRRCDDLCQSLNDAVFTFNKLTEATQHAKRATVNAAFTRRGTIGADSSAILQTMVAQKRAQEHNSVYNGACAGAESLIRRNDWMTQRMKAEATYWLEVLKFVTEKQEE